jgi:hypothetical protein
MLIEKLSNNVLPERKMHLTTRIHLPQHKMRMQPNPQKMPKRPHLSGSLINPSQTHQPAYHYQTNRRYNLRPNHPTKLTKIKPSQLDY